jgi:hypothetical protein
MWGAGNRRTAGWRFSWCIRELAMAGTANPTATPLHARAMSARRPICDRCRDIGGPRVI